MCMSRKFKGIIKFISKPHAKFAIVKEYKDSANNNSTIAQASVLSTVSPIAAVPGTITSTAECNASEQLTLTTSAYNVSITVDGVIIELDCSGDAGASGVYSIVSIINRINAAFNSTVASKTGEGAEAKIVLTGNALKGTVAVAAGAENDGLVAVFGEALTNTGTAELFDLSTVSNITVTVDNDEAVEINIQGSTPAETTIDEIIELINTELGAIIASKEGVGDSARIRLTSTSDLSDSYIKVASGSSDDALEAVFSTSGAIEDTGNSYETEVYSYKAIKADFSSKNISDNIQYSYNYGNNVTLY